MILKTRRFPRVDNEHLIRHPVPRNVPQGTNCRVLVPAHAHSHNDQVITWQQPHERNFAASRVLFQELIVFFREQLPVWLEVAAFHAIHLGFQHDGTFRLLILLRIQPRDDAIYRCKINERFVDPVLF